MFTPNGIMPCAVMLNVMDPIDILNFKTVDKLSALEINYDCHLMLRQINNYLGLETHPLCKYNMWGHSTTYVNCYNLQKV